MHRRDRVVEIARDHGRRPGRARIAVLGAAFKPYSDDVRDSPALLGRRSAPPRRRPGHRLRPEGQRTTARGRFPTLDYVDSTLAACDQRRPGAPPDRVAGVPLARSRPTSRYVVRRRQIIDGRNLLDAAPWRAAGWDVPEHGSPLSRRGADAVTTCSPRASAWSCCATPGSRGGPAALDVAAPLAWTYPAPRIPRGRATLLAAADLALGPALGQRGPVLPDRARRGSSSSEDRDPAADHAPSGPASSDLHAQTGGRCSPRALRRSGARPPDACSRLAGSRRHRMRTARPSTPRRLPPTRTGGRSATAARSVGLPGRDYRGLPPDLVLADEEPPSAPVVVNPHRVSGTRSRSLPGPTSRGSGTTTWLAGPRHGAALALGPSTSGCSTRRVQAAAPQARGPPGSARAGRRPAGAAHRRRDSRLDARHGPSPSGHRRAAPARRRTPVLGGRPRPARLRPLRGRAGHGRRTRWSATGSPRGPPHCCTRTWSRRSSGDRRADHRGLARPGRHRRPRGAQHQAPTRGARAPRRRRLAPRRRPRARAAGDAGADGLGAAADPAARAGRVRAAPGRPAARCARWSWCS